MNVFKEVDYNTVQLMYGFVLLAIAAIIAVFPSLPAVTGAVCLLLIKDGLPNLVVGMKKIAEAKKE